MRKIFILLMLFVCMMPRPVVAQDNTAAWEENLDALVATITEKHIDPFTHMSEADFMLAVESLRADLSILSDEQILMRMAALVAALGDAHTTLIWNKVAPIYPLGLQAFEDGLYVTIAGSEAQAALGMRLISINGQPLADVIAQVQTIIPHENDAWLSVQLPTLLNRSEVLVGLGIITAAETIPWGFETLDGEPITLDIAPYHPGADAPLSLVSARDSSLTPVTEGMQGNYWLKMFDDGTLYFKYNTATEAPDLTMAQFTDILLTALAEQPVERLVIDVRDNLGGNSTLLDPLITALKELPINAEGKLFVIIGAKTYSSGLLNVVRLSQETNAVLIGQPTGGSPNHFGEIQYANLPHFDLSMTYSTKYHETMPDAEGNTLMPDVLVPWTITDYLAGIDPFYAAVLAYEPTP